MEDTVAALEGKQLRYLIGGDDTAPGAENEVTELSFDAMVPPKLGVGVKYCNLFDEKYDAEQKRGNYGPYLGGTDVSSDYGEGQIDPNGAGWMRNLNDQFERARAQGFGYVELDNPDAYKIASVLEAVTLAGVYGLTVIAKNAGLMGDGARAYVEHPNVYGIIVEKDAGSPLEMDDLRKLASKPLLPVWFVAYGKGRAWAEKTARAAAKYKNMGVTYSTKAEYGSSIDLLVPHS